MSSLLLVVAGARDLTLFEYEADAWQEVSRAKDTIRIKG